MSGNGIFGFTGRIICPILYNGLGGISQNKLSMRVEIQPWDVCMIEERLQEPLYSITLASLAPGFCLLSRNARKISPTDIQESSM